jgi:hypothetical protein
MNVPGMPTDNLYKFMAIAGLALIAFSAYVRISQSHEIDARIDALKRELVVITVDIQYLDRELAPVDTTACVSPAKPACPSDAQLSTWRERSADIRKRLELNRVGNETLRRLADEATRLHVVTFIGTFIGFLLAIYGFYFWYTRLQRYQDAAVKRDSVAGTA